MGVDEGNIQVIDVEPRRDTGNLSNNYSSTGT